MLAYRSGINSISKVVTQGHATPLSVSRRWISIKTLTTPNENAIKYVSTDGELLQDRGSSSIEIKNTDDALIDHSKLAQRIFVQCPGVESLMIGDNLSLIHI